MDIGYRFRYTLREQA